MFFRHKKITSSEIVAFCAVLFAILLQPHLKRVVKRTAPGSLFFGVVKFTPVINLINDVGQAPLLQ